MTEEQRHSDFANVFSGEQAERVLDYLSLFCLKNDNTFVQGSPDKSAFNEGARAVMLEIDHWINLDLSAQTGEIDNTEPEKEN